MIIIVFLLVQEYAQYAFTIPGIHSILFFRVLPRYAHFTRKILSNI